MKDGDFSRVMGPDEGPSVQASVSTIFDFWGEALPLAGIFVRLGF